MEFRGKLRFLSNFWPCSVRIHGMDFPTVEHAYQACKSTNLQIKKFIQSSPTPGIAKRRGQVIKLPASWNSYKLEVMEFLVREKFNDWYLADKLIAINEEIQEGNKWGDTFWGVDLNSGKGENHLGKILMKIRDEIQERKDSASI